MPTPPLHGRALRATSWLSRHPAGARVIARLAARDFHVDELLRMDLGDASESDERPRAAAAPRRWEDAGLGPARAGGAARLRAAYRSGLSSPAQVLDELFRRIDQGDFGAATWSPFVVLDRERAMRAAVESGARYRAGCPLGPLDGVPVPVKDEHDMEGLPTRIGTAYRLNPAARDSFLVRRLRESGALVFAKTHLPEHGATPLGTNPHMDLPRCAYSAEHGAGGSSTGAAVAVALGLAPVAAASDAGGSIRIPSALNGVFGLKPTYIRIGRTGNPLALLSLPHLGPIGATLEDLVDFLEVTATVPDPEDPTTALAPDLGLAEARWRAALGRGVRGCRIGVPEQAWFGADPGVEAACRTALGALVENGARLVPVSLPLGRLVMPVLALLLLHEVSTAFAGEIASDLESMGADLQISYRVGASLPPEVFALARRARAHARAGMAAAFAELDVIILPTTLSTAPRLPAPGRLALADTGTAARLSRNNGLANLTGLPAISVPVGLHEGLPVGLQIIGDAWDEASVLAVASQIERLGIAALPPPPGYQSLIR